MIGEEEIVQHIYEHHVYKCTIYNTDKYQCNHMYHDNDAEWKEHKNLVHPEM